MATKFNNFYTDLSFSLDGNDDRAVNTVYKRAFPHLKEILIVTELELQKQGIDKVLMFESGNRIYIDEKKRRQSYPDILLEEYSDYDNKKEGWLKYSEHTDYVSYIVIPTQKVYLLPFLILQKSWNDNKENWVEKYGRLFAYNEQYRTSNVPVPTEVLLESIKQTLLIN